MPEVSSHSPLRCCGTAFRLLVAVATCANVVTSHAQISVDPRGLPVPNYSAVDQNGVDMGSGRLDIKIEGPTIGADDITLSNRWSYATEGGIQFWPPLIQLHVTDYQARLSELTFQLGDWVSVFKKHDLSAPAFFDGTGSESLASYDGDFGTYPRSATYLAGDGTTYDFGGFVGTKISKPNGVILTLNYVTGTNGLPSLVSVVSNAGYLLHFENGVVTAVNRAIDYCDPTAAHCTFSRTWPSVTWNSSAAPTVTFTDEANRVITVVASNSPTLPASITYPSGRKITVTYGGSNDSGGRVVTYQDGASTWNYGWQLDPPCVGSLTPPWPFCPGQALVGTRSDPNGATLVTRAYFGGVASRVDELSRTTTFGVLPDPPYRGRTTSVKYAEGNSIAFPPGIRGNIPQVTSTSKDGTSSFSESQVLPSTCVNPATCNKPTAVIDANLNETDYSYYPWGGVSSRLGPAVNGVRPLMRYFYTQLYAYIKNASGTLVQAESPIWRLTQSIECKQATNAAGTACASTTDEIVTNYLYGQAGDSNALLIHGRVDDANGLALRTCYSYDAVGHKISETTPGAGLASCP